LSLFPFALLLQNAGPVTPILPPILVFGAANAVHSAKRASGKPSGRILKAAVYCYYATLALAAAALVLLAFPYYPRFFVFVVLLILLLSVLRASRVSKWLTVPIVGVAAFACFVWCSVIARVDVGAIAAALMLAAAVFKPRVELTSGIFLNIFTLVIFSFFNAPRQTPDRIIKLSMEKYAKPIYLFSDAMGRDDGCLYNGLLRITTSSDGRFAYFTAKEARETQDPDYFGLYKVEIDKPSNVRKWSKDRMSDAVLVDGEKKLLATDYSNDKLWLLDADTLEPIANAVTQERPQWIIYDEKRGRATVTHEGLSSYISYSIPDLKQASRIYNSTCPEWVAVDYGKDRVYSANLCSTFHMLSEIDMKTMKTTRERLPANFFSLGAGVDGDRDRVYVTGFITGAVHALDQNTLRRVATFYTKPGVRSVAPDDKRDLVYVCNMIDPHTLVYDGSGRQIAKVFTGSSCRVIHVSASTGRVFVGSAYGLIELRIDDLLRDLAESRSRSNR
jgi:hypothetical protein